MNLDMSLDDMMAARKANPQPAQFDNGNGSNQQLDRQADQSQAGGVYPPAPPMAPTGTQSNRVFVGNLPWSCDWRALKDHFGALSLPPTHADVLMGSDGRSKGCGIVEFSTPAEALRAVEVGTNTDINGRQIFVREDREANRPNAQPNAGQQQGVYATGRGSGYRGQQQGGGRPVLGGGAGAQQGFNPAYQQQQQAAAMASRQGCRVYVGNLSWDVAWQDLKDHMRSGGGNVTFAEVLTEADGRSKGCGVVEFGTAAEAQAAIQSLNDTDLKGRMIFVREDRESRPATGFPGAASANNCAVYVGNLHFDVSWQDLKDHMRAAGNVDQADILTGSDGRSKGCGVVVYQNPGAAQRAIAQLQNSTIHGRPIFVREDREAGKGGATAALYVGNLSYETTWKELKDHFRTVGVVDRAEVASQPSDPTKSKGWGTVRMARARDAQEAIRRLNGSELMGRQVQVRMDNKMGA